MLEKNIDMALIGKSYLSYIFSLELLDKNKKVLLLDDDRIQYGEMFTNSICQIEKNVLEIWGRIRGIGPLACIDRYLTQKTLTFVVGNRRIRLGSDPDENLAELVRKFSFCFTDRNRVNSDKVYDEFIGNDTLKSRFNASYNIFCKQIAESLYFSGSHKSVDFNVFNKDSPENIRYIFKYFLNTLFGQSNCTESQLWSFRTFVYMARGYFQKKLSTGGSDLEIMHMILSLLSPYYELDHEALIRDLMAIHKDRGGQFKKTKINEWLFDNNRPWSIGLASYEGVIHPNKISFLGGAPRSWPIKVLPEVTSYVGLKVRWEFSEDLRSEDEGEYTVFSSLERMGTDRPVWKSYFSKNSIVSTVFIPNKKGIKISFLEEEIRELLKSELSRYLTDMPKIRKETMELCSEVWIEDQYGGYENRRVDPGPVENVVIKDNTSPASKEGLKNVYYFGPYKNAPLGLLSTLLEIRDYHL